MVIKKLGDELLEEFLQVVEFLALVRGMNVMVEPEAYDHCLQDNARLREHVYTWESRDDGRSVAMKCVEDDGRSLIVKCVAKKQWML
jgi:NAD+ kinase